MTSHKSDIEVSAHQEHSADKANAGQYTGDHETEQTARSPVERSLMIKAICLFASLSALVYFVAYLVSL